jgi:hypothetical protein
MKIFKLIKLSQESYVDIGHNIWQTKKPYVLWMFENGVFKKSPVFKDTTTHDDFFGKSLDKSQNSQNSQNSYQGRYDVNSKTISIGSNNGEIPNPILATIKNAFPKYENIYISGFRTPLKRLANNTTSIHLWLDDERDPSIPFIKQNFGANGNEIWVKSVTEAINYINQGIVASISFDNDLGSNLPEGYDLAKYIEEKAYNNEINPIKWKIHSANPKGKSFIEMAMNQADKFWNQHNQPKEHKEIT